MRKAVWRVGVAVLVLFMVAPAAAADHGRGHGGRPSVVPADKVVGSSGGALLGDWMAQVLAIPAPDNPFTGQGGRCLGLGRNGKVLSPAGGVGDGSGNLEIECEVAPGRPVLMVMPSAECSTAEDPPYYATTERDQRACAVRALNDLQVTSITLQVHRERPVEIRNSRFLAVSPQTRTAFPDDPIWGTPGSATFAAASWIAEIRGMGPGRHTVVGTTKAIVEGSEINLLGRPPARPPAGGPAHVQPAGPVGGRPARPRSALPTGLLHGVHGCRCLIPHLLGGVAGVLAHRVHSVGRGRLDLLESLLGGLLETLLTAAVRARTTGSAASFTLCQGGRSPSPSSR